MNKSLKKFLKVGGVAFVALVLAGCTASFCSNTDTAHLMYSVDDGVTVYSDSGDTLSYNDNLDAIIKEADEKLGYTVPSDTFWQAIDQKVLTLAAKRSFGASTDVLTLTAAQKNQALNENGYFKFLGDTTGVESYSDVVWGNWDVWVTELRLTLGEEHAPDSDFNTFYKTKINASIANRRACIAINDGIYGPSGEEIRVAAKSWGYAFEQGIIEGLLVYPVAAAIEFFTNLFGAAGWGQIWAILVVTIIVRGLLMAATFKSTMGTQKMQILQPELAKLQQKYPNSNTNNYEKQQLAQAQMALYKKHGINPFSQILVMFLQFPIFIAVWGAMTGSAILASGSVMGLNLNASLGTEMTVNFFSGGWWTAVVLFILMAASQFLSMKLPTWMQKKKTKNISKLGKNPAADKQTSQTKMITNVMFIMILVMSWSLPAAMGVYWFIGAVISMLQTLITQKVMAKKA